MKQFLVIGLGRFGSSLACTLSQSGHEVLGVDRREDLVQDIADTITQAVQADATDEQVLRSLGVANFNVAVVAIGENLQASIMCTLLLKEMGVEYVIAKARDHLHGKVLKKIGADRVVFPERDMGVRVAHNLVSTNLLDYIELSEHYSIMEITAPSFVVGKSLAKLQLPNKLGVSIIAIKTGDDQLNVTPGADDVIKEGDILVIAGSNDGLRKMEEADD